MKNYFSSDWHLCHANIIKYDNRPFDNIGQMNQHILDNYHELVKEEDNFYYLGDFCFDKAKTESFLEQMQGNLFFIRGNHDKKETIRLYEKYGTYLGEQSKIRVEGQDIVLNHYSMRVWDKSHHGTWHLYGHSHGTLPDDPNSKSFDVGCNIFEYKPLEFSQVKKIMDKKLWKPIDHHTGLR
jgi:calcineurin-like phosphoesterase family protein